MLTDGDKYVSEPTLRRLPLYLHHLRELASEAPAFISCTDIGRHLNLDPTQVRKDLEVTGIVGKPRVGYIVAELIQKIEDFLGWNNLNEAFLVGAGNLGMALLGYDRLRHYGVSIIAAFDTDDAKVGTTIYGKQVLPLEKLSDLARRMHVQIGIITVPGAAAQSVADLMVKGGIRAIWNFAPVTLRVPEEIIVQNEELYYSLASLSSKLASKVRAEATAKQEA